MNNKVFKIGLDHTVAGAMHLEEGQGMDKHVLVGQGMTQIIEETTETIREVIKGMGDKIIMEMDSEEILENQSYEKFRNRSNNRQFRVITEGIIEMLVTVDQGQVLE